MTTNSNEKDLGRVALWLDPEDLSWLARHCCCPDDAPQECRERCGRIRFRANAALHKSQAEQVDESGPAPAFAVYVDVDDTLVRFFGTKQIPMPRTLDRLRELRSEGATLYLWSTGGSHYARRVASELGITDLFEAFLPKPRLVLDDQPLDCWRELTYEHPLG